MSEKDPIRVYCVHLFDEDADYQRLFEYLESRDRFFYMNTAKPEAMPTAGGEEAIKEELRQQIELAEIVIIPAAIFERNPELAKFQLSVAQAARKPILGIQSFGGTVAVRKDILDRATDIVEWNDRVITDAIRKIARNEDTSQWEVIEFDPTDL